MEPSQPERSRATVEKVVREEWGHVLASLVGYVRDLSVAEDVLQDGLVAALEHWPSRGLPDNPRYRVKPNVMGTGIWWTTPLLLFVFIDFRKVWSDRRNRPLLISAAVVFAALMCYHSTGYLQRGYNRYSLDYIPAMFAMIAPVVAHGKRRWVAAALVAWGVAYFTWFL